MTKKVVVYFLILFSIPGIHAQTAKERLNGNPVIDISNLLKEGNHTADIMDGIKQTPEQIAIAEKFQKALQKNYSWFVGYLKTVPEGQTLPYHNNFGITKSEYEEILQFAENPEVTSSGTEKLTIIRNKDTISFKGNGRLDNLDSLKINLSDNAAIFGSYWLSYIDTVRITEDTHGLKSKWFGYRFSFQDPKDISLDDLKDLENLNYTKLKLTIGYLEKYNKTLLDFSVTKIEMGQKTVEIRIPIVFE